MENCTNYLRFLEWTLDDNDCLDVAVKSLNVVLYQPQGRMIRDAFLLGLVVKSDYLSNDRLSVSSVQSVLSHQ